MSTPTRPLSAFRFAARDVDPMSWFTGPYVPLVFALFIMLYGGIMALWNWDGSDLPWMQLLGVACCVLACVAIQLLTKLRNRFDWELGAVAVVGGGAGLIVSASGFAHETVVVELWWAPICCALVIACLAPYLSAWRLLFFGIVALVTSLPASLLILQEHATTWGPVSTTIIIATPIAVATAAATAFAATVVDRMLPIVDNRSSEMVSELAEIDPADEAAERGIIARVTSRAVPFLRGIAERGEVTPEDRALAGEIARYLRDDLVSRSDLAWLGILDDDRRVVVVDPQHRADSMRSAQRTAIRDLVRTVLDDHTREAASMVIELRGEDDGSTAVAITLDSELPEGRRVRHFAPYYFNLRGEVTDVRLGRDRLSFRVPPNDGVG